MASYIALAAILAYFYRLLQGRRPGSGGSRTSPAGIYLQCFAAGILLANAVPHLVHGLWGIYFPAPFFKQMGPGLATNVVNVVWATFNLVVAYGQLDAIRRAPNPRIGRVVVVLGVVAMGLFLAMVFGPDRVI